MAAIHFGIAAKSLPAAKQHLRRAQLLPVITGDRWSHGHKPASAPDVLRVTVYGSNTDRVLDVLFKSGFKSLLVPNAEGTLVIEDHS